jgi:hypothetical protein
MGEGDARVGLEPRLAAVASTHEPRRLRVDASEPADPAQTPTLDEAGPQTRTGPALSHSPSKGAARSVSTRATGPAWKEQPRRELPDECFATHASAGSDPSGRMLPRASESPPTAGACTDPANGRPFEQSKQQSRRRRRSVPHRNELGHLACANHTSALSSRQSRRRDCPCWLEADTFVEPVTSPVLVHCGSVTSRQSVSEAIGPERERRPGPGRHSMTLLGPARSRTGRGGSPNRQR